MPSLGSSFPPLERRLQAFPHRAAYAFAAPVGDGGWGQDGKELAVELAGVDFLEVGAGG